MTSESPHSNGSVGSCSAITRAGTRCQSRPMHGSQYCVTHSPAFTDEQRKAWNAKGGRHSGAIERAKRQLPLNAMATEDVRGLLGYVLRGVIAGNIEPPIANAAANVARALGELARVQADELISETERILDQVEGRAS